MYEQDLGADIPARTAALGELARRSRIFATICEAGIIPENGLPDHTIREFICSLAGLDSNNQIALIANSHTDKIFAKRSIGAGEREGRIISPLVRELHMGLAHGAGRSGSLTENQPKALGSSILCQLANSLALDAIRYIGISNAKAALVVPMATGMTLSLCLASWRSLKTSAEYVVYMRVDQRSGLKSILFAGLKPIIVESKRAEDDDGLCTDLQKLQCVLEEHADKVLAVLSTTSCFSPREPDDLCAIGKMCAEYGVLHLVNNAYGLQSEECRSRINKAGINGHIGAFVQSLDKNFLVPVGGAVVATFDVGERDRIAGIYPGRASIVPSRDLVITLLGLGKSGLNEIFTTQAHNFSILQERLIAFASNIGQRVLVVPSNCISLAMTLKGYRPHEQTFFGSMLFARGITGARVVCRSEKKDVEGFSFENYGSHSSIEFDGYLNVACALGMSLVEVEQLIDRLNEIFALFKQDLERNSKRQQHQESWIGFFESFLPG